MALYGNAATIGESLNVDFAGAKEGGALAIMKTPEVVLNGSKLLDESNPEKVAEISKSPATNGYLSDTGTESKGDGPGDGVLATGKSDVQDVDKLKKKTIINGNIAPIISIETLATDNKNTSEQVKHDVINPESETVNDSPMISSSKHPAPSEKIVSPQLDCEQNGHPPSEEAQDGLTVSRLLGAGSPSTDVSGTGPTENPETVSGSVSTRTCRSRSKTPVTTRSRSGTPVSVAGTASSIEDSRSSTPVSTAISSCTSVVSDGSRSTTPDPISKMKTDPDKVQSDSSIQGILAKEEEDEKEKDSIISTEKPKDMCVKESSVIENVVNTTEIKTIELSSESTDAVQTSVNKTEMADPPLETNPPCDTHSEDQDSLDAKLRSQSARSSEERSFIGNVRSSEERYLGSPLGNLSGCRSSEERSLDSTDSAMSNKSRTIVPKARKSGFPSSSRRKRDLLLPNNVIVKLPDFDNPIQIDSRTLEKISRLGKMENKHKGAGPSKFHDKHLPKKSSPKLSSKRSSPILSSPSKKFPYKRRKRKLGGYKLPNEIRKGKTGKKKNDSESGKDTKGSDCDDSIDGQMVVDFNDSQDTASDTSAMDVDNNLCVEHKSQELSVPGRMAIKVEADIHNEHFSVASESDRVLNNSAFAPTSPEASKDGSTKSVWDIFKHSTNVTPKSKNTLGSTRSTKGACVRKLEKMGKELHKGKTMDAYLLGNHPKSEPDTETKVSESIVMNTPSSHKVDSDETRKRKKIEDDDSDEEVTIRSRPMSTPQSPFQHQSGKKLKLEDTRKTLITVLNTPPGSMPTPTGLRSLLPRSLMGSPTNSMPKLETHTAMQNVIASNNPPKLIVLSSGSLSNSLQQPPFSSSIAMVTKPLTTGATPPISSPLCIKSNNSQMEMTPQGRAPVLKNLLTENMGRVVCLGGGEPESEKENSSDSLPSSMSYPVTPPKTPDDQHSEDLSSVPIKSGIDYIQAPPGPTPPDKDIIPLCCCKINGASFKKLGCSTTYCQALDSIDGKVMGCCNKVTSSQLVRPGVKIPFMALCEAHRKRLRLHQCCPGCGHFCTQGKFYHCRKEGAVSVHHFHKQCQVLKGGKYYCPHCGEESQQFEVSLSLEEPGTESLTDEKPNARAAHINRAKMSIHANTYRSFLKPDKDPSEDQITASHKLSNERTLSTGGVPIGPDKNALEKVINSLAMERPLKYRKLPKSMYNPAYEGDLEKIIYMIVDGFEPDEKYEDFDNQTSLHAAAIGGSLPIVHLLVQAGASIHRIDKEMKTPMMYAAENNHINIVQYFLKMNADVTLRAEDGMTVLHYAAKAGHVGVIKLLLEADKIDINVQDDGGWTPIIWASEHRYVNAVKYLVKNGADPNLKDKEENTSLHWAAFSGSVDIAEIFLNAGCDLETPNEHGDRPLHIAARQDHYECVVLFLARGADVEAKNNENEVPIQCCLNENSPVWLALRVNKQLKGFAAARMGRPERLIHRDVSMGRENIPIAVVNGADDDPIPTDFQYITENVETADLNINRTISSLQSCRCSDNCSSMFCVCGRNSVKCWYDRGCRLLPDFNMLEPPLIFECNKGCRCWSTCNNRVVQMGIASRLQMVKTNGRGWGVKSLLDIPKGMFICEYIGELISDSEADSREDDSYLFDLDNRDGDTYCIDARRYGNISRFVNHLCEPNLIPVKVFVEHQDLRFPRICFFSSRDIKADEELGFDYGEKFWMIKWKQFTCACGSPKCKYSSETIQKTLEDYRLRHEDEGTGEGGTT
ncbi:mucin-17-like isoform X2 [Mizuhopecten yessoensis]|uniref:mucin-17-like isoform X2 n=1 Tax=Mizuhopecten yessoensis TaxID=6573 RepID=UPI000B45E511|nr:mucin-17-like isoform X2 [Mizuhopecten yessoensis]